MDKLRINGQRLWDSIMTVAKIGPGVNGGSHRLALSDEDKQARDVFSSWCLHEGCSVQFDDMGNIFAHRKGKDNTRAPIVAGSHLDTQPHGGKFDGVYGVLAGLEVIRTLNEHKIETTVPIEIVNWTNEEGSRFSPAMLASGVFAGLFEKNFAYRQKDIHGLRFLDELKRIGYQGNDPCGQKNIGALFELHIEQGPILERNRSTIGVVTGGQGQRWFDITIFGQDAHAGSTPMTGRKDALVLASRLIQIVQEIALENQPDAVGTVGEVAVSPNSRNTIPGEVFFTIDFRHPDDEVLAKMTASLNDQVGFLKNNHDIQIELREIWHNAPVNFDQNCVDAVFHSTQMLGLSFTKMKSGAGHDACQISRVAPTAMIFVPCAGGLSHNELESAEQHDLEAGCNVLLHAILEMAA